MTNNNDCILYPICNKGMSCKTYKNCHHNHKYKKPIFYNPQHQVAEWFSQAAINTCIVGGGGTGDIRMGEKIVEGNLIPKRAFQSNYGKDGRIYYRNSQGAICVVDLCNTRKLLVNTNPPNYQLYQDIQKPDGSYWNYAQLPRPTNEPPCVKKRLDVNVSCNGSDIIGQQTCRLGGITPCNYKNNLTKVTRFDQYRCNAKNKLRNQFACKQRPSGYIYY